ncbi:Guanine nucleotide exchange factor mss4 [Operophtera brumata]|uniref:Guanine nucleotide exchange factor mss4 n=1 Tax=Operophtera brumata TaxID=104452 RepID=A0A0L7LEN9_OPEBR|nr:Guanine nucleotide exchange factor mss4 [Operophtera brumata]
MSDTEAKEATNGVNNQNKNVEDGKNKLAVRCQFCGSKILEKQIGQYMVIEKELPEIHQASNTEGIKKEVIKEFYHVKDMYIFENIGFTHEVDNCKYLTCADCEAGPLGWFDISTKQSYLALSRIVHK